VEAYDPVTHSVKADNDIKQTSLMYSRTLTLMVAQRNECCYPALSSDSVLYGFCESPLLSNIYFFKHRPGHSPTVNVSWFIANAYLANFYYTAQRDYTTVIHICDEMMDVYQESVGHQLFTHNIFPVIGLLAPEWSECYDKQVQQVLGFMSLSAYVLNKQSVSRSVHRAVCPVQCPLGLGQFSI